MNLLLILKEYSIFFIVFIAILYLLTKYPEKVSKVWVIVLFFLLGAFLAPLVTGAMFYPQQFNLTLAFTIPYVVIPAFIATSTYIKVSKQNNRRIIAPIFLWIIISIPIGFLFAMPMGYHPFEPVSPDTITRNFLILNSLVKYIESTVVPLIFCILYSKLRTVLALLPIPFVLGFMLRLL